MNNKEPIPLWDDAKIDDIFFDDEAFGYWSGRIIDDTFFWRNTPDMLVEHTSNRETGENRWIVASICEDDSRVVVMSETDKNHERVIDLSISGVYEDTRVDVFASFIQGGDDKNFILVRGRFGEPYAEDIAEDARLYTLKNTDAIEALFMISGILCHTGDIAASERERVIRPSAQDVFRYMTDKLQKRDFIHFSPDTIIDTENRYKDQNNDSI